MQSWYLNDWKSYSFTINEIEKLENDSNNYLFALKYIWTNQIHKVLFWSWKCRLNGQELSRRRTCRLRSGSRASCTCAEYSEKNSTRSCTSRLNEWKCLTKDYKSWSNECWNSFGNNWKANEWRAAYFSNCSASWTLLGSEVPLVSGNMSTRQPIIKSTPPKMMYGNAALVSPCNSINSAG